MAGAPNDGFLPNTLRTLFRLSRVFLDLYWEMHSKRRYRIIICSVILGELKSFRNYKGYRIIFRKKFRCNSTFYQSENFFSSLHHISKSENLRFPFSAKNSVTWLVKYEKLNLRNFVRNVLDKLGKLYMDGTFIYKFLAVLKQKKVLGNICFFEQLFYRKQ